MIKQILTSAFLFISIFSFAQGDILKSNRTTAVIKIDGYASEWQPLRFYDITTKLFFDFCNDDNNLYLCFQSNDDVNEMKIMRSGMTVSLSIKGKGKSKASIKFPLEQTADNTAGEKKNTMEVKGFKTKEGMIATNDNSGINVSMNRDENKRLTYEIAIPLKELSGDDYAKDFTKDLELAVEIHALKQNVEKNSSEGEGGRMNGGSGMHRNGGGMGGGGRGGGMQREGGDGGAQGANFDRASMFEKAEFKQKFILAVKQ